MRQHELWITAAAIVLACSVDARACNTFTPCRPDPTPLVCDIYIIKPGDKTYTCREWMTQDEYDRRQNDARVERFRRQPERHLHDRSYITGGSSRLDDLEDRLEQLEGEQ